ncbi:MAG: EamA family transporter RarD [Woeseiaceae bacterium]|nr:EamA family transporter RarD [Woeseiaceae bacterium]
MSSETSESGTADTPAADAAVRAGVLAGLIAYTLWGVFPVYFKLVGSVAPLEVLAHRIVWSVVFGALIIAARRQWREVRSALTHRAMLGWLATSAAFISVNWLIYIWAIQQELIFETSLGYYINPLMYVCVGVLFFGDRLRRLQLGAVALAAIGVLVLATQGDRIPYVALALGASFTMYGVIRKKVVIGAMPGLFVETLLLGPFALIWLGATIAAGDAAFAAGDTTLSVLLLLAGPFTVIPLMCFAIAARRLTLTTVGFMQFLAPTLQFLTGLYYGERLTTAHIVCFVFIWTAVTLFSIDAVRAGRRKKPRQAVPAGA